MLTGNLVFYARSGSRYLIYILSCAFFTWFAALQIEKINTGLRQKLPEVSGKEEKTALRKAAGKRKRIWLTAAMVLTLGVWIVLKYGQFLLDIFAPVFSLFGADRPAGLMSLIVPLGMSFYTFDAIGYMIDISRGKYAADRSYFHYLTFVSFFPHIIQGPFSRYDKLGETLFVSHDFSYDRLCQGASRILWGYFKKLIIADKLAAAVNEIFANYENYWGIHILFVTVLYGIQVYADFSGYMDIVSGISHILGITLEKNFEKPYFAVSVENFWRRWHMTLGHWFRDYLFYPISMSKSIQRIGKKTRECFGPRASKLAVSYISMFPVWSVTGLWHGANLTFLVWGWLNMLVMMVSQALDPVYEKMRAVCHISLQNKFWHAFRVLRTFCLICFLRFFSRADSLQTALQMLRRISAGINRKLLLHPLQLFPQMRSQDIYIMLIGTAMMFLVDILCENGKWEKAKEKTPFVIRSLIYVIMIYIIILFAGTGKDIAKGFIYANF
ncbi:MAG: MBOAT family protein [Flexilinea sp.]|nr:MBOAT family protein [Flexilinea sp.]